MTAIPVRGGPVVVVGDVARPTLSPEDLHHLSRVRRLRDGDELIVTDGRGHWRQARHRDAAPEPAGEVHLHRRAGPEICIAFALVKGAKPELVVQKLTEVGVDVIRPFVAARSVVRWSADKEASALDRLAKVAREAAMQSRRAWLPTIARIGGFDAVASLPGACLADMDGAPPSLDHPVVMIGPEGGWDDHERVGAEATVALGGGVLRAETAAIVAGSLLCSLRAGLVAPI